MSSTKMESRSPVQHMPSGAIRSARVGALPEPIRHRVRAQPPAPPQQQVQQQQQQQQPPPQQQQPQQQQRSASVRRVVQAGEQPYWQYSGYQTPQPDATDGNQWDEFFSVLHNRPYCEEPCVCVRARARVCVPMP